MSFDLKHEYEVSRKIVSLMQKIGSGSYRREKPFERHEWISMTLLDKVFDAYQASLILAVKLDDLDDAFSLLRTAVEGTVNAGYILFKGTEMADRYADFLVLRRWADVRDIEAIAPSLVASGLSEQDRNDWRKEYERVRPNFGTEHEWAPESLSKRAEFVDLEMTRRGKELLGDAEYLKQMNGDYLYFRLLLRIPWREGSSSTHGTAAMLSKRVKIDEQGEIQIHRKTTDDEKAWFLYWANLEASQAIMLVDTILEYQHAEAWRTIQNEWLGADASNE